MKQRVVRLPCVLDFSKKPFAWISNYDQHRKQWQQQ